MKKTLIALAVAASAAVSGSAMAWTANGTGGSVDLGGTLTPVAKVTPWEVNVGAAVNDLNGFVQKGVTTVDVPVNQTVSVLGIRTQTNNAFQGASGIAPQINYGNAVDVNGFTNSVTTVSLDVKNGSGDVIGRLVAPFMAVGVFSWKNDHSGANYVAYAENNTKAFFGGLGKSDGAIMDYSTAKATMEMLFPGSVEHFTQADYNVFGKASTDFSDNVIYYSGAYASGIKTGETIKITLDQPATSDAINWTAQLPVTVYYQ